MFWHFELKIQFIKVTNFFDTINVWLLIFFLTYRKKPNIKRFTSMRQKLVQIFHLKIWNFVFSHFYMSSIENSVKN